MTRMICLRPVPCRKNDGIISFCAARCVRRMALFALFSFVFLLPVLAQGDGAAPEGLQQVLVPRNVFVGDRAELRCTFQSSVDFFAMAPASRIEDGVVLLDHEAAVFARHAEEYTVEHAVLQKAGTTCTLIITFVPWRTGAISFDEFDLAALCGASAGEAAFPVRPSLVEISSLADKVAASAVRPPLPPLLLPGTSYVLWVGILLILLLLVGTGFLLARFSALVRCVSGIRENAGFYWNARSAQRRLSVLGRKKCPDIQFAGQWQAVMRAYLSYRFGISFSSVTARGIAPLITRRTGDMLDIEQDNALSSLTALFIRTDYIRFAGGSIDSRLLPAAEHEAVFAPGERERIIALSCQAIAALEQVGAGGSDV